jgi:ATP-dependent Clp protease protease subunit
MKKPLLQVASDGIYELIVEGIISSDSWWGDEFTPEMVREELAKANGNPLRIIINSPGGECFAGAAIYNALREYSGHKTVRVDGVAASMASVIAMVGDEIHMSPGSTMMIHRPSVGAWGNVEDLKKAINMLEALEETIIPIYEKRTGLSKDAIFELLDKETWMSPTEAIELGFADKLEEDTEPTATAFEKIKAMLSNEQFAFSMSAVHKSLEDFVAKAEAPEKESEVETEETPEPEAPEVVETEEETTDVTDDVTETEEVESVEETPEVEDVTEPTDSEIKKPVAKVNMKPNDAAEVVVPAPEDLADPSEATATEKPISKAEYKTRVVEMISLAYKGDKEAAAAKAKELTAQMVINGTSGDELYGSDVLATDIRTAYQVTGRVGSLVNRIDIEGAETFKQLVETAGAGFRPVALGGVKQEDQPVWTPVTFTPHEWALIVAWLDGVQKRSPIAIYNQIVRYIAREYAKLEDKIVLTYEGGTVGGETFQATGLVPILTTASRVVTADSYDSTDVIPALGEAYGEIESDLPLALAVNRRTWGRLATSLDGEGRPIFTVVGDVVAAGALGTFKVVQSQELEDGDVVFGAYDDYDLVTRGALATFFSREATVGSLNLFTQDASALRADVDITGGPVLEESFILLQIGSGS